MHLPRWSRVLRGILPVARGISWWIESFGSGRAGRLARALLGDARSWRTPRMGSPTSERHKLHLLSPPLSKMCFISILAGLVQESTEIWMKSLNSNLFQVHEDKCAFHQVSECLVAVFHASVQTFLSSMCVTCFNVGSFALSYNNFHWWVPGQVIDISKSSNTFCITNEFTYFPSEEEVLLNDGLKFKVASKERK